MDLEEVKNGKILKIIKKVNKSFLANLLNEDFQKKEIRSAHWFRNADNWYRLNYGYNNPYNLGDMHPEYLIINNNSDKFYTYLNNSLLVFYGIGVGDTETELLKLNLESKRLAETIAIDVNLHFLENFLRSIKSSLKEYDHAICKIRMINALFEQIVSEDLLVSHQISKSKAHICLGNTIGNYNKVDEFLKNVIKNIQIDELLIIGFQLNTHIQKLFNKYKSNDLWYDLIGNFLSYSERKKIQWKINTNKNQIEAWYNGVQIFRSKKFRENEIADKLKVDSFKLCETFFDNHQNMCIQIFRRK